MKYQKGDLVKWVKYCPHLHLHRHYRPQPNLYLRLEKNDLGIVCESIPKNKAWLHPKETDPNCYVIYWQKHKEKGLVYEDEIEGISKK